MMVTEKSRRARGAQTGALRIDVRGPAGERIPEFRVTLLDARSGRPLPRFLLARPDEQGLLRAVPAGRYRLRVDPLGRTPDAMLLPAVAPDDVLVGAGGETRAVLRCAVGGRLRLALRTPGNRGPAGVARVRCRAADALASEPLRFFVPGDDTAPWAVGLDVPLDRPALSHTLLAPGPHELAAQARGFRPVRRIVHVPAGAVAALDLALERV